MLDTYKFTVEERFLRYVQIDTQSDGASDRFPSTEKQKDLGKLLEEELQTLGLPEAHLDPFGYVYATLPANVDHNVPVICFCAHMDTSPDCSGTGVKPIVHNNYAGTPLVLPDDPEVIIDPVNHPYLLEKTGNTIITASGTTLLGADDKAGVAVIMDMVEFFVKNPQIPHGTLKILFTPDEEIGRGVDKVDLQKLGAHIGYTLDAGELGAYEDETFSADGATVEFYGISAHPGYAKEKLVSAIKMAAAFVAALPKNGLSPEMTAGREGFVHPVQMEGTAEKATVQLILRDFATHKLTEYVALLQQLHAEVLRQFPGGKGTIEVKEQYRNMKEVIDRFPEISSYALRAIEEAGIVPRHGSARGGTDGSRLSFMGLPCPNIFTGEMAFHGKEEYVSVQDMEKSVEVIVRLASIWAKEPVDPAIFETTLA